MPFELEKYMSSLTINNVSRIYKNVFNKGQCIIYGYEIPVYYRNIDIVLSDINVNCLKSVFKIDNLKKVNMRCLDILAYIYTCKKVSKFSIMKGLVIKRDELEKYLELLVDENLIKKVSKFSYSLESWDKIIPQKTISIELKLSKWQEALEQAIFNLKFSNYSFVILDEDKINIEKMNEIINEYKKNNIGLALLNSNGKMLIKYYPKKNKNIDKYINNYYKIKILKEYLSNQGKWKEI